MDVPHFGQTSAGERSYTILVCLRLDIYSALELYHLFNPTLLSIEIDYKSV